MFGEISVSAQSHASLRFETLDLGRIGGLQCPFFPQLAAMAAAVLFLEALFLADGAPRLTPFIVPENALIAIGKKLEWLFHLLHVVKLHGVGLVKILEVRRIDKVAHWNAVDLEAEIFHRISTFIGVHS